MIAINNTTAFAEIEFEAPPAPKIDLTPDVIDNLLTGSEIINSTITAAVKTMLLSIIGNANVSKAEKDKIAAYAGFKINPDNTVTLSGTLSLDKLTFYVIFRLPYTNTGLTYEDIGNGLTSSTLVPSPTAWGKYANYIRSLTGSGIRKINSAGEQVDSAGNAVDDNGDVIEGWYNEKAYAYLGENPFSVNQKVPTGCYSTATEKAMLFGQNTNLPNGANPSLPITQIPLYFYLLAKIENPYSNGFWLNSLEKYPSRIPHWPGGSIKEKTPRRHFVKQTSSSPNVDIPNSEGDEKKYTLINDNVGTFFWVDQPAPNPKARIYIEPISTDTLTFEGLDLKKATRVEKNNDGLLAVWGNRYDNPRLQLYSGLSIGIGVDVGALFHGIYTIEFEISFTSTGTFRLYSGDKRSDLIDSSKLTCTSLQKIIANISNVPSGKISVKDSSGHTTGIPKTIVITREKGSNFKTYNHKIYASDIEPSGFTVTFTPSKEEDRWKENNTTGNKDWQYFNRLLNYSFSNTPSNNGDEDDWLNNINLNNSDKEKLVTVLKKSFNCQWKAGYHIWDENKTLFQKLELKSYVQNLRATYNKIFIPRFYSISNKSLSIEYLLKKINTNPNQAELFALVLYNYNLPSAYVASSVRDQLIKAINTHSKKELITAIELKNLKSKEKIKPFYMDRGRRDALKDFVNSSSVILKLYHGIND